jgi:hypothetical protein
MESVYYVLKYSCSKIVKKSHNITAMINQNPEVQNIQLQLDLYDEQMDKFDRELKIMLEKHRIHIKELRNMIKNGELNRLEKFVVKDGIKTSQQRYKDNRKTRRSEITKENRGIRKTRNKLSNKLSKLRTTLRKDIRDEIKERNQDKKERKKAKKQLRKTLRKQGKIREAFKDGVIKDLVTKYNAKTKEDFLKAKEGLEKEARDKQLAKEAKEAEREKQRKIKEAEREEKRKIKEAEREKTRKEKEAEKTRKKREKEREKEEKRREKELRKTQKKKSR